MLKCDINKLSQDIDELQKNGDDVKKVEETIKTFEQNGRGDEKVWFNELCYCILTANSNAQTVFTICEELCPKDAFLNYSEKELAVNLKERGYRFYNKRAEYIVEARKIIDILKKKVLSFETEFEAREWLISKVNGVKLIKGIGLKESSHFLRNVGYKNLAILDRHILKILSEKVPKTLSEYCSIENQMRNFANKFGLNLAELDLFLLWKDYFKTGKILK